MPAIRNVRRSRRLSRQEPLGDSAQWETYWGEESLLYPTTLSPASSQTTTPSSYHSSLPSSTTSSPSLSSDGLPSPSPAHRSKSKSKSSHARQRGDDHIPRPPNAFIMFRKDLVRGGWLKESVERDQRCHSRVAGHVWNSLSPEQRAPYHAAAEREKQEHARLYPDYKYHPSGQKKKGSKRRVKRNGADDQRRCEVMAKLILDGYEGDELERRLNELESQGSKREPKIETKAPKIRSRQRVVEQPPSPPPKQESPQMPGLTFEPSFVHDTPVFAPTEDMSALALSSQPVNPEGVQQQIGIHLLQGDHTDLVHHPVGELYLPQEQLSSMEQWTTAGVDYSALFTSYAAIEGVTQPINDGSSSLFVWDNPSPFATPDMDLTQYLNFDAPY